MVRGQGPHLVFPSLDTGSLSFLATHAPQWASGEPPLPGAPVAGAVPAPCSCGLAQPLPLSGPEFPGPSNTVKVFQL